MAEEGGRVNVMSVELAIQRELAYRKKVASSLSPSAVNFMKDLLPLQEPSSSPPGAPNPPNLRPWPQPSSISTTNPTVNSGSSHETPSSTTRPMSFPPPCQIPSSTPTPVPNPSYSLPSSNTSAIPFPTPSRVPIPRPRLNPTTRPRQFGIKRKATTSSLHRLQPPPPQPRPPSQSGIISIDQLGNFFCKVCQVPCTGAESLKMHLKGHKHKAKLQLLRMGGNASGQQAQQPTCELCQIWCSDQNALEMHLKGQKHKAKVREVEVGSKNGGEKASERPWCDLCQIWCMNEDALQQHYKGQKHVTRLFSIQEKMRGHSHREGAASGNH